MNSNYFPSHNNRSVSTSLFLSYFVWNVELKIILNRILLLFEILFSLSLILRHHQVPKFNLKIPFLSHSPSLLSSFDVLWKFSHLKEPNGKFFPSTQKKNSTWLKIELRVCVCVFHNIKEFFKIDRNFSHKNHKHVFQISQTTKRHKLHCSLSLDLQWWSKANLFLRQKYCQKRIFIFRLGGKKAKQKWERRKLSLFWNQVVKEGRDGKREKIAEFY